MKYKEIWNFTYKGFNCEIVHWNFEVPMSMYPSGNWNGYIYLPKHQLKKYFKKVLLEPKRFRFTKSSPLRTMFDYGKLDKYFDFSGGITYYELQRDEFNGKPNCIKVGNDYMHYHDEGQYYSKENIKNDLEKSVDTFITFFPSLLFQPKSGEVSKI